MIMPARPITPTTIQIGVVDLPGTGDDADGASCEVSSGTAIGIKAG